MSVVNCRDKGVRIDVYVGRPSKWGNPFQIGRDGSRSEVIAKYETWLYSQKHLMDALPELAGKNLGCWCAPLPCHADILYRLAERAREGRENHRCQHCGNYTCEQHQNEWQRPTSTPREEQK